MNRQINIRLSDVMLRKAQVKARRQGYENLQEFIRELLREKVFETVEVSKKEMNFLKKLYKISEEKNLYGTERELFAKLDRK